MEKHGIVAGLLALAVVGAAPVGCESAKPPPPPPRQVAPEPRGPAPLDVFSAERAWSDLLALTAASVDGGDPRAVLRAALEPLGLDLRELDSDGSEADGRPALHHLIATLTGTSPDLFVLIAPYDGGGNPGQPPLGGNVGASGAALLLELARVFSTRTNAYTLRFVFLAGEQSASTGSDRWRGSLDLAARMDEQGELEHTRLLVAFDGVCGPDLRVVRDLGSHRVFREEFFKAARRVGRESAFPVEQGFQQTQASHVAFLDRGLRASVAIVGARAAGDLALEDPPSGCVPESLEAVGLVALEAIDTIAARLAKIDRFARSPLSELAPLELPAARDPIGAVTTGGDESGALPATARDLDAASGTPE